eukprot:388056_1
MLKKRILNWLSKKLLLNQKIENRKMRKSKILKVQKNKDKVNAKYFKLKDEILKLQKNKGKVDGKYFLLQQRMETEKMKRINIEKENSKLAQQKIGVDLENRKLKDEILKLIKNKDKVDGKYFLLEQ